MHMMMVDEEVLHSVFLHTSISRMEDHYQVFFGYVNKKEYPP